MLWKLLSVVFYVHVVIMHLFSCTLNSLSFSVFTEVHMPHWINNDEVIITHPAKILIIFDHFSKNVPLFFVRNCRFLIYQSLATSVLVCIEGRLEVSRGSDKNLTIKSKLEQTLGPLGQVEKNTRVANQHNLHTSTQIIRNKRNFASDGVKTDCE